MCIRDRPYAVVDVTAEHEGYDPVHVAGGQVFDGEVSLLGLLMIPVEEDETAAYTCLLYTSERHRRPSPGKG